ncbi:MAG: glycosyltransferase [Candidatus Poseidoniia archaeon]|nr:glycosyltransferase [Candidatus Poseidoniia archaeon]|tara:strand:- start:112 stop:1437 length:1326 start_codon:yes stop_codon:yes gene_type:complete
MSQVAISDDIRPIERRRGLQHFLRIETPKQFAFWILFVGLLCIVIFVRFGVVNHYHPLFITYMWIVGALILSRYVFFAIYNPPLLEIGEYEPTIAVIVPAKNESQAIHKTAKALHVIDYPAEKLQVILVNDGSDDDTGEWMDRCGQEFGHTVVHMPENRGKREAIAEGMTYHNAEITILVDSDSMLEPNAIKEGVRGFYSAKIGAICGHTDVKNAAVNWLTRMQTQQYFIAFRTFRALEGYFGSVICCSGAFSLYRTEIIRPMLNVWLNQTFLGLKRTYGDDRGLTNLILREGYDTIYVPTARARTIVPHTLSQYMRQQIRWRRSFLMESISAVGHMWRRPKGAAIVFYGVLFVTLMAPAVVSYFLLYGPLTGTANPLTYAGGLTLIVLMHQTFYWAFQLPPADKVSFFSFMPMLPMWVLATLILLPWALLTLRERSWGTR